MTGRILAYGRISEHGTLAFVPEGVDERPPDPGFSPLDLKGRDHFFTLPRNFGRMDGICKLAMTATEIALTAFGNQDLPVRDVAQAGGTAFGCHEVDARFEESRLAAAPSPALFVYTLPSMFQGEIAIHYGLRGRSALFSCGGLSGLCALATAVRWVERGLAPCVLAIAVDTWRDGERVTGAAAAWLIGSEGLGVSRLKNARFDQPAGRRLEVGHWKGALSFIESLESCLKEGYAGYVSAVEQTAAGPQVVALELE